MGNLNVPFLIRYHNKVARSSEGEQNLVSPAECTSDFMASVFFV